MHVICTRLSPGQLSVRVGDGSRHSEEIVKKKKKKKKKISNCAFQCDYYSSAFTVRSLGFTIVGEIFVTVFFFVFFIQSLCSVYVDGPRWVCFLLPAFTHLGHECQDLLSSCDENSCAHRLDLGLYSHPKEFWWNGIRTHINSKGKIPSTGRLEPATLHLAGQRIHLTTDWAIPSPKRVMKKHVSVAVQQAYLCFTLVYISLQAVSNDVVTRDIFQAWESLCFSQYWIRLVGGTALR